jgi:hypothetical protein
MRDVVAALLVCAVAVGVYYPSLSCDFVFDDRFAIENNEDTTSKQPLSQLFLHDFWGAIRVVAALHSLIAIAISGLLSPLLRCESSPCFSQGSP